MFLSRFELCLSPLQIFCMRVCTGVIFMTWVSTMLFITFYFFFSLSLSLSLLNKFHAHNNRETLIDSGDTDRATRTPFKG